MKKSATVPLTEQTVISRWWRLRLRQRKFGWGDIAALRSLTPLFCKRLRTPDGQRARVLTLIAPILRLWRRNVLLAATGTGRLAWAGNCRPACVTAGCRKLTACNERLCPFCHARTVKLLFRKLRRELRPGDAVHLLSRSSYVGRVDGDLVAGVRRYLSHIVRTRRKRVRDAAAAYTAATLIPDSTRWRVYERDVVVISNGSRLSISKIYSGWVSRYSWTMPETVTAKVWRQLEQRLGRFMQFQRRLLCLDQRTLCGLLDLLYRTRLVAAYGKFKRMAKQKSGNESSQTLSAAVPLQEYMASQKLRAADRLTALVKYVEIWRYTQLNPAEYVRRAKFIREHWPAAPLTVLQTYMPYTQSFRTANPDAGAWTPVDVESACYAFFEHVAAQYAKYEADNSYEIRGCDLDFEAFIKQYAATKRVAASEASQAIPAPAHDAAVPPVAAAQSPATPATTNAAWVYFTRRDGYKVAATAHGGYLWSVHGERLTPLTAISSKTPTESAPAPKTPKVPDEWSLVSPTATFTELATTMLSLDAPAANVDADGVVDSWSMSLPGGVGVSWDICNTQSGPILVVTHTRNGVIVETLKPRRELVGWYDIPGIGVRFVIGPDAAQAAQAISPRQVAAK